MKQTRRLPIDPYFLAGLVSVLALGAVLLRPEADATARPGPERLEPALLGRLAGLGLGRALGDAAAPVQVVELSDYQCPACAAAHARVWPAIERHAAAGRVRYTLYDLPLASHANAVPAAVVGHCVAERSPGAFWRFRGQALARQGEWADAYPGEPVLLALAHAAGADRAAVGACVRETASARAAVLRRYREAATGAGLAYTPAWAVDGKVVAWERLEEEIRAALADGT